MALRSGVCATPDAKARPKATSAASRSGASAGRVAVEELAEVVFVARLGPRDHVEEQALLVAVVVVHRALGDARLPGDRVDAGAGEAVAEEQRERGALDRRPLGGRTFPDHGAILHCTV